MLKKQWLALGYCLVVWQVVPAATLTNRQLTQEVLQLVNRNRAAHGLNALVIDAAITETALQHSQAMADKRVPFGHQGFKQRMQHLYSTVTGTHAGAENVAYNYKSAQSVVDGWMQSRGHRHNLLGHYNLTGIGIVRDAAGKLVYTQLFLRTTPPQHG